ncbi:MAG: hypothetical protein IT443_08820 [Phycisphaeraceae bacterium]|nr:hypothetical protein [Phycisphaeraceae bacterium]
MVMAEENSLLAFAPGVIYKSDARSRVWKVELPGGVVVIKRFEHSPLRQRLAAWLGIHSAQREWRKHELLRQAGLPVVPIVDRGCERGRLGSRLWLATPWLGETVHQWFTGPHQAEYERRRMILLNLAQLAAGLISGGWFFKDFKTTNVLLDEKGRLWLIDVGCARRLWRRGQVWRMLAMLNHTLARDGATRADRYRVLARLAQCLPTLGTPRQVSVMVKRVVLK